MKTRKTLCICLTVIAVIAMFTGAIRLWQRDADYQSQAADARQQIANAQKLMLTAERLARSARRRVRRMTTPCSRTDSMRWSTPTAPRTASIPA